ncbi:MAG: LemA family protein [Candidatus Gracilibacteria bacterium]
MNKTLGVVAVIAAVVLLIGAYLVSGYNGLIGLREEVNTSWSKVQSDYQRRSDLIPNLVQTVKGAAGFEQQTLERVIQARASATQITVNPDNAGDIAKFQQAQGELSSALSRLLVVSEQYPQLQAVQGFRDLQVQLEGTENRISVARKDYGDVVKVYNQKRNSFPTIILAGLFGFPERAYFEADSSAQTAPSVDFSAPVIFSGSTL